MKLKLTVDVPSCAEDNMVLQRLLGLALNGHGITVVEPLGLAIDVDLVDVERLDS